MVTGFPDVRLTPYMGAVVLYDVLHSLEGGEAFLGGSHVGRSSSSTSPLLPSSLSFLSSSSLEREFLGARGAGGLGWKRKAHFHKICHLKKHSDT